jgi:hypothetical protein
MDEKTLHALDLNFYHAVGAMLGNSGTGEVRETQVLYLTCCGFPASEFNVAFLKLPVVAEEASEAIESAEAYFRSRKFPFRVSIRKGFEVACAPRLLESGYRELKATPGMVLSPIRAPAPPHPDLEVRRVCSPEELEHFQSTAIVGFGLPVQAGPIFLTRQFFELPNVELYVGYLDGRPACTSALVASGVPGARARRGHHLGSGAGRHAQGLRAGELAGLRDGPRRVRAHGLRARNGIPELRVPGLSAGKTRPAYGSALAGSSRTLTSSLEGLGVSGRPRPLPQSSSRLA